jgi:hypothetical protein
MILDRMMGDMVGRIVSILDPIKNTATGVNAALRAADEARFKVRRSGLAFGRSAGTPIMVSSQPR